MLRFLNFYPMNGREKVKSLGDKFSSSLDTVRNDTVTPVHEKITEIEGGIVDILAEIGCISRNFSGQDSLTHAEQEEQGVEVLFHEGILPFPSMVEAIDKIITVKTDIYDNDAIALPTSIFQTPMKTGGVTPSDNIDKQEYIVKTAEKWQLFLKVLHHNKISIPENSIYKESIDDTRMRKVYYRIAYIESPMRKTICVSDQIGEAIYIYDGFVPLTVIIAGMKQLEGYGVHKVEWKGSQNDIADKLLVALYTEGTNTSPQQSFSSFEGMSEEAFKRQCQLLLIESSHVLSKLGIYQTKNGGWDLRNMVAISKASGDDKKIGGKGIISFPSGKWNKHRKIGNGRGVLENPQDVADMLISIGYSEEQIIRKSEDPLEWKDGMDEEDYKQLARKFFEEAHENGTLKKIGILKTNNGTWDLKNLTGNQRRKGNNKKIGGKSLTFFPSSTWNKKKTVGSDDGRLQNPQHVADMLISIGYSEKQIIGKPKDPLEWKDGMDEEDYKQLARKFFEEAHENGTLKKIGILKTSNGKWDFQGMTISGNCLGENKKIGGRNILNFPSAGWNIQSGIVKNGKLQNARLVADMLVSIGYSEEQIIRKSEDPLEWKEGMDEKEYKKLARKFFEEAHENGTLKKIGILRTNNEKWDLSGTKNKIWRSSQIGGKSLTSFPSGAWNKKKTVGNDKGRPQNIQHIADMLVSIGYSETQIIRKN